MKPRRTDRTQGPSATEEWPVVTIGIPCLNEEPFIETAVRCALRQDYPADRLEVVVADGGSTDGTRHILQRIASEDTRLRVISNPARIQAAGMNEIIRGMQGEILVRLDAHSEYADDYVRRCVEVLRLTGADNVGGAQRARARTWFQRALCAALDSPLGVGNSAYRSADKEGFVDTVYNGAFLRRVFETVGLFDANAVTNEDAELNQRILQSGGKIYLSRSIVAHYYPRDSMQALAVQYFHYGRGRARTALKHRSLPTLRPLIPFAMVLGGATLLATSHVQPLTPYVFGLYALATGAEAVRVGRHLGPWAVPVIWTIFPVMHVSHGVGFAVGLVQYAIHPDWADDERLPHTPSAHGTGVRVGPRGAQAEPLPA